MNKTLKEIIEEIREKLLSKKLAVDNWNECVLIEDIERLLDDYYELNRLEN